MCVCARARVCACVSVRACVCVRAGGRADVRVRARVCGCVFSWCGWVYWAIQAGLLTPFTFAWHRLSPLAAFISGAYFLHNGRR